MLKLASYEEYYALLTSRGGAGPEMANFIDAVSTNETYFFREGNHFTALDVHDPSRALPRPQKVRIWSAGLLHRRGGLHAAHRRRPGGAARRRREPEIVGTDISTTVIARAREGIYRDRALRLVPPELLEHVLRARAADGGLPGERRGARARGVPGTQSLHRSSALGVG